MLSLQLEKRKRENNNRAWVINPGSVYQAPVILKFCYPSVMLKDTRLFEHLACSMPIYKESYFAYVLYMWSFF